MDINFSKGDERKRINGTYETPNNSQVSGFLIVFHSWFYFNTTVMKQNDNGLLKSHDKEKFKQNN